MNQTLNTESLMQISLFQKLTKAKVKDCFEDNFKVLTFCVLSGELHKAIGKNGSQIQKLEKMFKRKLRVIEYNTKIEQFIKNICYPNKVLKVEFSEQKLWDESKKIVRIEPENIKSRGYIIGKDGANLRNMEKITKRYFDVDEIKVTSAKKEEETQEEE